MEVHVLASGSKGNVTYIKSSGTRFFVDVGIRINKIKEKLNKEAIDLNQIDTVFITHEHSDHIIGLKGLLALKTIKQVYLTNGTLKGLPDDVLELLPETIIIQADQTYWIGDLKINVVASSHDANEPVGYIFEEDDKKIVYLTDTGYIDVSYHELMKGANLYILEANHDPNILMKSTRPFHLKQRIIGITGHLSNDDAAIFINKVVAEKAIWVVAHISEDCNNILAIEKAIVNQLDDPTKVTCHYTSQESLEKIKL